ncbi:MAG: YcaO-like family protein [Thermodesulfobacteriota bacterium]
MINTWSLTDRRKGYTADLDKTRSPEETIRDVRERFASLDLDILSEIVRIDNGRLDIPVFFSVCGADAQRLTGTTKQMGKGATPAQAEASAIMELVERFSFYAYYKRAENFIYAAHNGISENAMPLDMIAQSVDDVSDDRDIALAFFAEQPMKWAKGFNLARNQPVLVPFDWFFAINEFNGTSSGNCLEEALGQGICEVVERHVCDIISRNRLNIDGIDPDSAKDEIVTGLIGKYRKNNIDLYISDFSLDTGVPTVGVMAHDPATFPEKSELVWTAGTMTSPEKALNRALTEVAQLGGDFNTGANFVASGLPKYRALRDARYITHPGKYKPIDALPDVSHDNIKVEVERLVSALAVKNLDVIAVDTTHPALGVPALYTVVPGARFRERAAAASVGLFTAKHIISAFAPEEALVRLQAFDRRLPGKYYIQFYTGQSHLALGDPATALDYFNKALEQDPDEQDLPGIYSYMGVCLKEMERYREALNVLKKAEEMDDERTDVYNLAGYCHFKLKAHKKAIRAFKQVIRLNPSSAIDYANIAVNYREMGDTQKAIEYFRTALRIDPGIGFARENLEKLLS